MDLLGRLITEPASRVYGAFNGRAGEQIKPQDPTWLEHLEPEDRNSVQEVQRGVRGHALLRIDDQYVLVQHHQDNHPGRRDKAGEAQKAQDPLAGQRNELPPDHWGYRVRVYREPKPSTSRVPYGFITGSLIGVAVTAWAAVHLSASPDAPLTKPMARVESAVEMQNAETATRDIRVSESGVEKIKEPVEVAEAKADSLGVDDLSAESNPNGKTQPALVKRELNSKGANSWQPDSQSMELGNVSVLAQQSDELVVTAASPQKSERINQSPDDSSTRVARQSKYHTVNSDDKYASGWCSEGYIPWRWNKDRAR
ncbi:hypothetical protein U5801_21595 [Lamprobacter modestohalophilus]|uniref:hypothetical protein n=1 Tax=Lamprobacter modestohalophilus TaxID=1064514 RepID=UPI002ADEC53B|nr:hypothetical protein [Lamprobacter modestohalophilus]MEA1052379.1 hypothetical protein [Lamprobacter modestohalophilus]